MALTAILEQAWTGERRSEARHRLRLISAGQSGVHPRQQVAILDISVGGFLLESSMALELGEKIEVELPEAGQVLARVAWNSGVFFGCRFVESVSRGVVSAALLRGAAHQPDAPSSDAIGDVREGVRDLRARVEQLGAAVEAEIARLAHGATPDDPEAGGAAADAVRADDQIEAWQASDGNELAPTDDRLSFANRLRVILLASLLSWAAILWAVGII